MLKAIVLVLATCGVDAANYAARIKAHDDVDIAKAADEELQGLEDLSNNGLWQESWSQTLAKHDATDALMNDNLKKALYPEAQLHFNNLIQARHRLKEKMKAQQEAQGQQQDAQVKAQQQDKDFFEDAKAGFLQRMTAGLKDVKDDDPPSTTTTTTTEDAQVVKERQRMALLKDQEMAKMTEGVAEVKDDTPSTTTTTIDPAAKAEKDHFEELKAAEMSKLTANLDDKSVEAAEATATTTTTTTTTTFTLGAAGQKIMAEITSGKYVLPTDHFAGIQTPQQPPAQDEQQDDGAMSETMQDLDQYGF